MRMVHHETQEALIIHEFQEVNGYLRSIDMTKIGHLGFRSQYGIVINDALARHAYLLDTDEEYKEKWDNYPYNTFGDT
ncbi:MAG: hypothetical protein ACXABY_23850 [Candidatus Thorarchaeota archaeon]|jgi:hypothetical protein